MAEDMKTVYELANDSERITEMQQASRDTDVGLSLNHGLVGSDEWWKNIEEGTLALSVVEGKILEAHGGPMGDWPSIRVDDGSGKARSWTAYTYFDPQDKGRSIRIEYVKVDPKKLPLPDYKVDLVIRILVGKPLAS